MKKRRAIWDIISPMSLPYRKGHEEIWVSSGAPGRGKRSYRVNVKRGKVTDICSLKTKEIHDLDRHIAASRALRVSAFRRENVRMRTVCPVCGAPIRDSLLRLNIDGGRYHQCMSCDHVFVKNMPAKKIISRLYEKNRSYASTYTDERTSKVRLRDVAMPNARWVLERYKSVYGRRPKTLLDVGSGGGHFVHASRKMGIDANGLEYNGSSREFARSNFGLSLSPVDFARHWERFSGVDVITFWGVIEHTHDPMKLLRAAHKALKKSNGFIVVGVPRWNSLSTFIQSIFRKSVSRHLVPLSHMHCFTDNSLATAFEISGFAPTDAWYFGMDMYELITQVSYALKNDFVSKRMSVFIPSFQIAVDEGRLSDELILAGRAVVSNRNGMAEL